MSDAPNAIQISYQRVGPRTGILRSTKGSNSFGGMRFAENQEPEGDFQLLGRAMATAWLYELARRSQRTARTNTPQTFLEILRCGLLPTLHPAPRFPLLDGKTYPHPHSIVPQLVQASRDLIQDCVLEHRESSHITIVFKHQITAHAFAEPPTCTTQFLWTHLLAFDLDALDTGTALNSSPYLPDFGRPAACLKHFSQSVEDATFSHDGRLFITADYKGYIEAFDATSFERVWSTSTPVNNPEIDLNPNGETLRIYPTYGAKCEVRLDLQTGHILKTTPVHINNIWAYCSPKRRWALQNGINAGEAAVGDFANAQLWRYAVQDPEDVEVSLDLHNGRCIVTSYDEPTVFYSIREQRITHTRPSPKGWAKHAMSPNAQWHITIHNDTILNTDLHNPETQSQHTIQDNTLDSVSTMTWSQDGRSLILATYHTNRSSQIFCCPCTETQEPILDKLSLLTGISQHIDHDFDEEYTYIATTDTHLLVIGTSTTLFQRSDETIVWRVPCDACVNACCIDEETGHAILSTDHMLVVLGAETGERREDLEPAFGSRYPNVAGLDIYGAGPLLCFNAFFPANLECFAWDPNERYLYVAPERQRDIEVWDLETQTCTQHIRTPFSYVRNLASSPDGSLLAIGQNTELRIIRLEDHACLCMFSIPSQQWINNLRWSPDGRWFAIIETHGDRNERGYITLYPCTGQRAE